MICRFIRASGDQFLMEIDRPWRRPVYDVADQPGPRMDFRSYDTVPVVAVVTRYYRYTTTVAGLEAMHDYFEPGDGDDPWCGLAWPIWLSPNPAHSGPGARL